MRRTLIAAAVLVTLLLLAAVTLLVVLPKLAEPAGPNPYPAPSVSEPAGCDAYDALAQTPPLPSLGKVGAALDEARKPWIEVDRSKLAGVTERLGLGAAAAAFAAAKVCPAFEDHPERAVVVHGVLRAALLSLVARELAVPGSARADLLDYLRLTTERGHAARSTLGLGSALLRARCALVSQPRRRRRDLGLRVVRNDVLVDEHGVRAAGAGRGAAHGSGSHGTVISGRSSPATRGPFPTYRGAHEPRTHRGPSS